MNNFGARYMRLTTPEQRKNISLAGNKAIAIAKLNAEPRLYAPMMSGCQMGAVLFNLQCPQPQFLTLLLFEANQYKFRFRSLVDGKPQDGLNGWQGWLIEASRLLPPANFIED